MNNKNNLQTLESIGEEIKLIEESKDDYITPSGKVYSKYGNLYFCKKLSINKHNGYLYVGIRTKNGYKSRRVHILVAKAFLENPNNYPIVMHLDNNKANPNVSNLRWGTISENTQQAFDDGLIVNDKGFDDSQSMPIDVYDIYTWQLIEHCGSIGEAAKKYNYGKNTIINSANNQYTRIESQYYFRWPDSQIVHPRKIAKVNFETDEIEEVFINTADASIKTGIGNSTIRQHIFKGKPKRSFGKTKGYYFKELIY